MKKHPFQIKCDEQILRLCSIARDLGISEKPPQVPFSQTSCRSLSDALMICPDDASAGRALVRYSDGWPVLLFFARQVGTYISNGHYTPPEIEEGVCPFFHVASFFSSFDENLNDIAKEIRSEQ